MKWKKGEIIAVEIIALILFALLMGCNKNYYVPESQADAGSVHIAVLSVAPWDKYVEDLQPVFDMTPEKALKEVIPTTGIIDEKIIDALGAGLKVALPTASVISTSTFTTETGKEPIAKTFETKEKKPGDISAVKGGDLSLPQKKPTDITHPLQDVDIDPMTKYLAATALYQEVKLLNTYIKNAAMYCVDCTPYVVRIQISLMPRVRNLPYDIYTLLSFFNGNQMPDIKRSTDGTINPNCWPSSIGLKPPYVLPLLVTDNLEGILRSSSEDKIRDYTFALSALISGVGVGGNFEKTLEKLKSRKGKDLNSLLTVGKVTDNTLRVRLGARQVAGLGEEDRFAMSPRTNTVTVLLMVPGTKGITEPMKIGVLAKTNMVNAVDGSTLNPRPIEKSQLVQDILLKYSKNLTVQAAKDNEKKSVIATEATEKMVDPGAIEKIVIPPDTEAESKNKDDDQNINKIRRMIIFVGENQWEDFIDECKNLLQKKDIYCNTLWQDMAALYVDLPHSTSSFYLPNIQTLKLFPNQTVLMLDDTSEKTSVVLNNNNGENLSPSNISATLYMDQGKKEAVITSIGENDQCKNIANHYPIISENVVITEGGGKAIFSFPSLKAWGFDKNWGHQKGANKLEITYKTNKKTHVCLERVLYVEKPQPAKKEPGFALKVTTSSIVATKDGRGTLQVTVKKSNNNPPAKIFYDVEGADIENITSKPSKIFVDKGERYVKANGTVTFRLNNLKDNSMVTLIFSAGDRDSSVKVTVPVDMTK